MWEHHQGWIHWCLRTALLSKFYLAQLLFTVYLFRLLTRTQRGNLSRHLEGPQHSYPTNLKTTRFHLSFSRIRKGVSIVTWSVLICTIVAYSSWRVRRAGLSSRGELKWRKVLWSVLFRPRSIATHPLKWQNYYCKVPSKIVSWLNSHLSQRN